MTVTKYFRILVKLADRIRRMKNIQYNIEVPKREDKTPKNITNGVLSFILSNI